MQEFLKRMCIEKDDLEGKIRKAKKALETPPFGIDSEGISLLKKQLAAMENYLDCLKRRISYEIGKR